MLKSYLCTDVGRVRPNNEDCGAIIGENVFVAADGMGGAAAGERASGMTVETLKELIPQGYSLAEAIKTANGRIFAAAQADPSLKGMGTTVTVCRVTGATAEFAHVGDSRLYLLRGRELRHMTQDHSYVEELVRRGDITSDEARIHPMKNMLTRAVGATEEVVVDCGSFALADGDKLLLTTDGLTNMIGDFDIRDIMLFEEGDTAKKLVDAALAAGGRDNVTVISVIYHAD